MSKLDNYDEVTKIYEILITKKNFSSSLSKIVKKYIKSENNEIEIVNKLIKKLSNEGYEILEIDPIKIKEI